MQNVQQQASQHDQRHDAKRTVSMQAQPEKNTAQDEIIARTSAQGADQKKKCGRCEQWIERKAQPDTRDHIGPVGDPEHEQQEKTRQRGAELPAKQINEWKRKK